MGRDITRNFNNRNTFANQRFKEQNRPVKNTKQRKKQSLHTLKVAKDISTTPSTWEPTPQKEASIIAANAQLLETIISYLPIIGDCSTSTKQILCVLFLLSLGVAAEAATIDPNIPENMQSALLRTRSKRHKLSSNMSSENKQDLALLKILSNESNYYAEQLKRLEPSTDTDFCKSYQSFISRNFAHYYTQKEIEQASPEIAIAGISFKTVYDMQIYLETKYAELEKITREKNPDAAAFKMLMNLKDEVQKTNTQWDYEKLLKKKPLFESRREQMFSLTSLYRDIMNICSYRDDLSTCISGHLLEIALNNLSEKSLLSKIEFMGDDDLLQLQKISSIASNKNILREKSLVLMLEAFNEPNINQQVLLQERIVTLYQRLSALGDLSAKFDLAFCHYYGLGTSLDQRTAIQSLKELLSHVIIFTEEGVQSMPQYSIHEKNLRHACSILIDAYTRGVCIPQDLHVAEKLKQLIIDLENPIAKNTRTVAKKDYRAGDIAQRYSMALSKEQDMEIERLAAMSIESAKQENKMTAELFGRIKESLLYQKKDRVEFYLNTKKAILTLDYNALLQLAEELNALNLLEPDKARAAQEQAELLIEKALITNINDDASRQEIAILLRQATLLGISYFEAKFYKGLSYAEGYGVDKNYTLAFNEFNSLAHSEEAVPERLRARAFIYLSKAYSLGIGIQKNKYKAKEMELRAISLDDRLKEASIRSQQAKQSQGVWPYLHEETPLESVQEIVQKSAQPNILSIIRDLISELDMDIEKKALKAYYTYVCDKLKLLEKELLLHKKEDQIFFRDLISFFQEHWFFIKESGLMYTARPDDIVTVKLCMVAELVAHYLNLKNSLLDKNKRPVCALEILIPNIQNAAEATLMKFPRLKPLWNEEEDRWDMPNISLENIIKTHIWSRDYLLPVQLLLEITESSESNELFNVYFNYDGAVGAHVFAVEEYRLTEEEEYRLFLHSRETQALYRAKEVYCRLMVSDTVYARLLKLCSGLSVNSKSGLGIPKDANPEAYSCIFDFRDWYDTLDEKAINRIPSVIRECLDKIFTAGGNSNASDWEAYFHCTNLMGLGLKKLVLEHKEVLQNILIRADAGYNENRNAVIEQKKGDIHRAKKNLEKALSSEDDIMSYSGSDDKMGLSLNIYNTLSLKDYLSTINTIGCLSTEALNEWLKDKTPDFILAALFPFHLPTQESKISFFAKACHSIHPKSLTIIFKDYIGSILSITSDIAFMLALKEHQHFLAGNPEYNLHNWGMPHLCILLNTLLNDVASKTILQAILKGIAYSLLDYSKKPHWENENIATFISHLLYNERTAHITIRIELLNYIKEVVKKDAHAFWIICENISSDDQNKFFDAMQESLLSSYYEPNTILQICAVLPEHKQDNFHHLIQKICKQKLCDLNDQLNQRDASSISDEDRVIYFRTYAFFRELIKLGILNQSDEDKTYWKDRSQLLNKTLVDWFFDGCRRKAIPSLKGESFFVSTMPLWPKETSFDIIVAYAEKQPSSLVADVLRDQGYYLPKPESGPEVSSSSMHLFF